MIDERRARRLAAAAGAVVLAGALTAVGLTLAVSWSFAQAVHAFVVSNCLIGVSFGLCGALIAAYRPQHPVGWLYAAGGILQLATAVAAPVTQLLHDHGASLAWQRIATMVFGWSWAWHIGLVLPLSLLLLPDGRLPSPRWRPVAWAVVLTAPLFVVEVGAGSDPVAPGLPRGYATLSDPDGYSWLWSISEARWVASVAVGVLALALRFRRGDEQLRRQLLWLLAAAAVVVVAVTPWALVAGTPIAVLFAIPLLPVAITIAILRYRLLDIRLVLARGVAYALLSGLVLALYAGLVIVLSGLASALIAALAVMPLRLRLQRAVERLLYGDRVDPLRVASRVGGQLGAGLNGPLAEMRAALRLPWAAIRCSGQTIAAVGEPAGAAATVDIDVDTVLLVGLRPGERRLAAADERVLTLLAGPLATAVHAMRLSQQLQLSREHLIAAREEERRRLRRDLHDGLGPLLTGLAMSADAAANLVTKEPRDAVALLTTVRSDSRTAIGEIRRIIDDLRPPALDELGLVGALESRAARTVHRADGAALRARVEAPADIPPLPAAIEVAAYRIATEALTNAARHSDATTVTVRLSCTDALHVEITDDGTPRGAWTPGVGISGMHERAAELGGRCVVGATEAGGRVLVSLPLELP